jgi:hypothetical protein
MKMKEKKEKKIFFHFLIGSYVKTSSFNCGHLGFTTIFFRGPHNKQIHHSIEKILQCQGKIFIFGFLKKKNSQKSES